LQQSGIKVFTRLLIGFDNYGLISVNPITKLSVTICRRRKD